MYAIVEIAGILYKVSPDKLLYVPYLGETYKEGEEIIFNPILFVNKTCTNKLQVKGKVMIHIKNDKITIFKKKRRKGYQFQRGHRQKNSIIKIFYLDLDNYGS